MRILDALKDWMADVLAPRPEPKLIPIPVRNGDARKRPQGGQR